jgi:type I restriction enzyme S subunit
MNDGYWFGKVAEGWDVVRLKRAVMLSKTRTDKSFGEVRYIGLENIESWTGRLIGSEDSTVGVDEDLDSSTIVSYFEPGDVLFGKLRPYLAKAHLVTEPSIGTTELLALKPSSRLNGRFLLYVLLSPAFIGLIDSSTFGTKMPRADWGFIGNVMIPLPSLIEQQAIVEVLDRKTEKLDALVKEKEELLALLTEKRRSLITYAVTHGLKAKVPLRDSGMIWLGEIPTHWREMHLKRVLTQVDYGISESVNGEGNVAVLRMGDIHDGEIRFDDVGFVEDVDPELLLEPDDLVFNRTNSLDQIGKVGLFRGYSKYPVTFASYLVRLRCSSAILPEFLNYLLNAPPVLAWSRSEALPAIGQANLNPNRYGFLRIALPPLDEQHAIVTYVRTETKKLDDLRKETERTIRLLKEHRAALIAAAVTGQLAVTG